MDSNKADLWLWLFDFDSSLLDLPGFVLALPEAVDRAFTIPKLEFANHISRRYDKTKSGRSIGYNIFRHLKEYGLDLAIAENKAIFLKTMFEVHQEFTNGQPDFLYPDVREPLRELRSRTNCDIQIASVNVPSCLAIKVLLGGPLLEGISAKAFSGNKGDYYARQLRTGRLVYYGMEYDQIVIVDDNADQLRPIPQPPGVAIYQIVRPGQKYPPNDTGTPCIKSFAELPTL